MGDYPTSQLEMERWFDTNDACRDYLAQLRWPGGFKCPACGGRKAWETSRGLFMCSGCGRQTSVTAGTIFQDTKLSLMLWFRAIWWVTSLKHGASALGVQRILGLGSYRTAWSWLHKLRRAMVRPGRERLTGSVEVDESRVGSVQAGASGRHLGSNALLAIAAEVRGRGIGRIRLRRIEDNSGASILPFVEDVVSPGDTVITDGWHPYRALEGLGYTHTRKVIGRNSKKSVVVLPRVHLVSSLLKRWLIGTHQGAVSNQHLDYYLDEFTFRFNRRTSTHRGMLFYRLLQQAVEVEPAPYESLVKGVRPRK